MARLVGTKRALLPGFCELACIGRWAGTICLRARVRVTLDLGQVMEANYRLRFLSALPLLKEIPRGPRKAVITRAFSQVEYNANETIILQGQVGTTFFVIREGKVNVLKDGVKQAMGEPTARLAPADSLCLLNGVDAFQGPPNHPIVS